MTLVTSSSDAGYEASVYCKWLVRADDEGLSLNVVEARIYPVTSRCDFDGFVVLTPDGATHGKRQTEYLDTF